MLTNATLTAGLIKPELLLPKADGRGDRLRQQGITAKAAPIPVGHPSAGMINANGLYRVARTIGGFATLGFFSQFERKG